jgi:hypothetical protein
VCARQAFDVLFLAAAVEIEGFVNLLHLYLQKLSLSLTFKHFFMLTKCSLMIIIRSDTRTNILGSPSDLAMSNGLRSDPVVYMQAPKKSLILKNTHTEIFDNEPTFLYKFIHSFN